MRSNNPNVFQLSNGVKIIHVGTEKRRSKNYHETIGLEHEGNQVVQRRTQGTSQGDRRSFLDSEADRNNVSGKVKGHMKTSSHSVVEMNPLEDKMGASKKSTGDIFIIGSQAKQMATEHEQQEGMTILAANTSTGNRGDAVIQIEPEENETELKTILNNFFQLMYFIGLSTYDPRREKKHIGLGCQLFFKFLFWIVAISAFLHSFQLAKVDWLYFALEGGITNFVDVGFRIVPILAEVNMARIFAFQHGEIKKMLSCINVLMSSGRHFVKKGKFKLASRMLMAAAAFSILVCGLETLFDVGITDWSSRNFILRKSEKLGFAIFLWKPEQLQGNATLLKYIKEHYATNVTWLSIFMGVSGAWMDLCCNLKLELITDLVIIAGWCFKECIRIQASSVRNIDFRNYTNGDDAAELESEAGHYAQYQKLKQTNKAFNVVFDGILKFMHVQNTMTCAYFLMHLFDPDVSGIQFIFLIYNIIKLGVAYRIAKQSHGYNVAFQEWIRKWAMHSKDTTFLLRVPAILDEMKGEPLGLGTGEFIIGESFILKFVGMVTSMFMFQVDKGE